MPIQMAGVFRYLITLLLLVNGLPTGAAPDPVVMLSRGDCQRATADAGNEMTALHRAMCAEQAARRAGGPPDERTLLNIDRLLRQAVAAGYPAATRYRAGFLARYDLPGDSDPVAITTRLDKLKREQYNDAIHSDQPRNLEQWADAVGSAIRQNQGKELITLLGSSEFSAAEMKVHPVEQAILLARPELLRVILKSVPATPTQWQQWLKLAMLTKQPAAIRGLLNLPLAERISGSAANELTLLAIRSDASAAFPALLEASEPDIRIIDYFYDRQDRPGKSAALTAVSRLAEPTPGPPQERWLLSLSEDTQSSFYGWPLANLLAINGLSPAQRTEMPTDRHGDRSAAELLYLKHGSVDSLVSDSVRLPFEHAERLLDWVLQAGDKNELDQLLAIVQPPVSMPDEEKPAPLWRWASIDDELWQTLLTWQGLPATQQSTSQPPLMHLLLKQGQLRKAEYLLTYGYRSFTTDSQGRNDHWWACKAGAAGLLAKLQTLQDGIHATDNEGAGCVMAAVTGGDKQTLETALLSGANPDQPSATGNTPLMLAAMTSPVLTGILLNSGADFKVRNSQSQTALMLAVINGCPDCAQLLIRAGANPARKDSFGRSSIELAKFNAVFEGQQELFNHP